MQNYQHTLLQGNATDITHTYTRVQLRIRVSYSEIGVEKRAEKRSGEKGENAGARESAYRDGVHRSRVKMQAMHLHTPLDTCRMQARWRKVAKRL